MPIVNTDYYGHLPPSSNGAGSTALAAGAVATTVVGTIVPTTNAGAAPTVTAVDANDTAGTFTLTPVTGGGAQAAGSVAEVRFAQPYSQAPRAVMVSLFNNAAASTPILVAAAAVTGAGFNVAVAAVLVTANVYTVRYDVTP